LNIELPTGFRQGLMECCQLAFGVYIHLDDRCGMHPGAVLKGLEEFKPRLTSILGISGFDRVEELVAFCTDDQVVSDDVEDRVEAVEVEVKVEVEPKKKNTNKKSGFERRMR